MKTRNLFPLLLLSIHCHAQGLIIFYNRNLEDPDTHQLYHATVSLPGGGRVEGQNFTAGLFLVHPDRLDLVATSYFQSGAGAGFFVPPRSAIEVPGYPPGSSATFRARVWETAAGSYEAAMGAGRYHGEFVTKSGSPNIFIRELGMANAPAGITPPTLAGVQPLVLIPESSTATLVIVGTSALLSLSLSRKRSLAEQQPQIGPIKSLRVSRPF